MVHPALLAIALTGSSTANLLLRRQGATNTTNSIVPANATATAEVQASASDPTALRLQGDLARTGFDAAQGKPAVDAYTFFRGDGSAGAGWPTVDEWASFDELFANNAEIMGTNCVGGVAENTAEESQAMREAILRVSEASAVDARYILATVMQESNGCVRVRGTPSGEAGVFKPGVMQSFRGSGSCNLEAEISPCPASTIEQMLVDGVQGVNTPDAGGTNVTQGGLVQRLSDVEGDVSGQAYYQAARGYNSGTVAASGNLEDAGTCGPPRLFGVPCYASDIANRLLGFVRAESACEVESVTNCEGDVAAGAN